MTETPSGLLDPSPVLDAPLPAGQVPARPAAEPEWLAVMPVPDEAYSVMPDAHPKLGQPDVRFSYRTADGELAFEVWRFNRPNSKRRKIIQPISFGRPVGEDGERWDFRYPAAPRPLYNLDEIAQRPEAIILLVEGEKAAEAVKHNPLYRDYVAAAWSAGAASLHLTDLAPLAGRKVLYWPDNDEAGLQSKERVVELVDGAGGCCLAVAVPDLMPEGWDLADPLPPGVSLDAPRKLLEGHYLTLLLAKFRETEAKRRAAAANGHAAPGTVGTTADGDILVEIDLRPSETALAIGQLYEQSDTGNAQRILTYCPNALKWCPDLGWLAWDGKRWANGSEHAKGIAQRGLSAIKYEGASIGGAAGDKRTKWGVLSMNNGKMEAALECLKPHAMVAANDLDRVGTSINTPDGVVDLRTGRLTKHHPSQLNTHITRYAPAPPGTPCPKFTKFLHQIMPEPEMRAYIQKLYGYFLTGLTSEQAFFFLYGQGSNGKGQLIKVLEMIMGDGYARNELPNMLFDKGNNQGLEIVIGRQRGARLLITSEPDSNFVLAEGVVKLLTGEDRLPGRKLYKEGFNFDPTHKVVMLGNHKPRVKSGDFGTWRRIKLLPFKTTITEGEKIDKLGEYLASEEGPAILRWAIDGAQMWFKEKLGTPDTIKVEVEEYKEEENTVLQWINDACHYDVDCFETVATLYKAYTGWCEANFYTRLGRRQFSVRIGENAKIKKFKGSQGRGYTGLKVVKQYTTREDGRGRGRDDDDLWERED